MASRRAFSSPSSSSSHQWSYDVFLSFRGEDTRKNFTNHLYFAFRDAGVNTFIDDGELRRGENIATELPKAIQGSKISVIVFSKNYAASRWCLDELVEIMKCRQTVGQLVLPIFHNVDPSEVRKQTGSFGAAFARHEKRPMAEVLRWKAALTEAANLSGWDLTSAKDGYEAEVIKKIVGKILDQLNNHLFLDVAKYPVGLSSRVKHMNSRLCIGSNDVRIIGICGIGGIGKTTLAKEILNKSFHFFECRSFLADVRENSEKSNGLVHLQEQLLYDILKNKIEVGNIHKGVNVIKERLCNKKVAIVLDDVDNSEQLNALARKHDWFGLGSRIIITSRDEHLLKEIKADSIYIIKELDDHESLELFSWHAFGESYPKEDYVKLSKQVMGYCGGLPLALTVLGSFLIERSIPEWKSALDRLENSPHEEIQKTLRISYDGLKSDQEKEIFLDIAFFLIGVDKDNAINILDGCGFSAEIGISVLIHKCLLTVNEHNQLAMHDLLRDMGRNIVREESPKEPRNRSRLWSHDDVLDVLEKQTGGEKIEGLILNLPTSNEVHLSREAFKNMHNLRLLQLNYVHVMTGGYHHFPKKLRRLCWHGFPLKFIPNSIHVDNLVDIDMQYSKLRQVWSEIKLLGKLKFLDLSHSHWLIKTPDFTQLPNLEKLILEDCISLVEVHASIGDLDQLVLLNLRNCKRLRSLPWSMWRLKSLEILDLSNCSVLKDADETTIRRVLSSVVHLKNLNYLSLCSWEGLFSRSLVSILWSLISPKQSSLLLSELQCLSSLRKLYLANCNLSDEDISMDLGSLPSLKVLDLGGNKFHSLPASINKLPRLSILILDNCEKLQSLPELPTNWTQLSAINCSSLESLSNLSIFKFVPSLYLNDCHKVFELPCSKMSQDGLLQSCFEDGELYFPGNKSPKWFTSCTDSFIDVFACRVSRFITRIYYMGQFHHASDGINSDSRFPARFFIIGTKSGYLNSTIGSDSNYSFSAFRCTKDVAHTNLESGDQVEVGAQFDDDIRVGCVDERELMMYQFSYRSPASLSLSDELLQWPLECLQQFYPEKEITKRFPHRCLETRLCVNVLPISRFITKIHHCAFIDYDGINSDSSHHNQNLSTKTKSMTLDHSVYSHNERIRQIFSWKKHVTQTNLESEDQVEVGAQFDDDIRSPFSISVCLECRCALFSFGCCSIKRMLDQYNVALGRRINRATSDVLISPNLDPVSEKVVIDMMGASQASVGGY